MRVILLVRGRGRAGGGKTCIYSKQALDKDLGRSETTKHH